MELVLLLLLPLVILVCLWTLLVGVALVTWLYVRTCYDGAEHNGRRYWPRFRKTCCCIPGLRWVYGYKGDALADRSVIYAVHPHGMMTVTPAMALLGAETSIRLAVHSWFFTIPIIRDLMLWIGCIEVTPEAIGESLARGRPVGIIPGGVREQDNDKQRPRGFLEWNYHCWRRPVIPVWCPHELSLFHVWKPALLSSLREWGMRTLRYPVGTLFWPRWPTAPATTRIGRSVDPLAHGTVEVFIRVYWEELERIKT